MLKQELNYYYVYKSQQLDRGVISAYQFGVDIAKGRHQFEHMIELQRETIPPTFFESVTEFIENNQALQGLEFALLPWMYSGGVGLIKKGYGLARSVTSNPRAAFETLKNTPKFLGERVRGVIDRATNPAHYEVFKGVLKYKAPTHNKRAIRLPDQSKPGETIHLGETKPPYQAPAHDKRAIRLPDQSQSGEAIPLGKPKVSVKAGKRPPPDRRAIRLPDQSKPGETILLGKPKVSVKAGKRPAPNRRAIRLPDKSKASDTIPLGKPKYRIKARKKGQK